MALTVSIVRAAHSSVMQDNYPRKFQLLDLEDGKLLTLCGRSFQNVAVTVSLSCLPILAGNTLVM